MKNPSSYEQNNNDPNLRQTYIQAPISEPINLDMNAFNQQNNQNNNEEEEEKKDLEIINECMERHTTFNGVM